MSDFFGRGWRSARRTFRGTTSEQIRRVDPTDARAVANIISDLRHSIERNNRRGGYSIELINALSTRNYEIARFIFAHTTNLAHIGSNYFLDYIRTDEYRSGNGFELAERLYHLSGSYMQTPSQLAGTFHSFQRDALDALLAPYYTLDAASIFGANASDENAVEYLVLCHVAFGAWEIHSLYALFPICMWFLTKLIEFGPDAHVRPHRRNDDGDDEDALTRQSAASAIYDHLEIVVTLVYKMHVRQEIDDHPMKVLAPKLCEAIRISPQFRQRVHTTLYSLGIDVWVICDQVAAAEVVPPVDPTVVIVGAAAEEEEEEKDDGSAVVVAAPVTTTAQPPARAEYPEWARFSDPEDMGVRLQKRRSPTGGGTRRRPRQQRRRITTAGRRGKWKQRRTAVHGGR